MDCLEEVVLFENNNVYLEVCNEDYIVFFEIEGVLYNDFEVGEVNINIEGCLD